jgi:cytochrome c-type biogenesis protein CcmH
MPRRHPAGRLDLHRGLRAVVWAAIFAAALALLAAPPVKAVEPDEVLQDATLEARARLISEGLRCLVCQNQSIDDSQAPLAKDLRLLVRERLTAGDTDQQIEDFVVARYGEFVLLKPRFTPHTLVLWFATPAVFLAALLIVVLAYRRRSAAAGRDAALSPAEQDRLDRLLKDPGLPPGA